jgi:hypothetical protein
MPELVEYTQLLLGGDARGRYTNYASLLVRIFTELHRSGVRNTEDLYSRVQTRQQLEDFASQAKIHAHDIVSVLKFLVYWYIPGEKYLSGLVRDDPDASNAIKMLSRIGIRTNLDLLQQGRTVASRTALAASSALPEPVVFDLVNRADLSRMPWASKATISNILGAGYASPSELANAEPGQLFEDFFRYGKSIGKT